MFDRSFDAAASAQRAVERKPVLMKPEQIDALKKEFYDAGFAGGKEAGKGEQAALLAATLGLIEKNIESLMQSLETMRSEQSHNTRDVILAIAKKIVPDLAARHGLAEIETLLDDSVRTMAREPRLVVRVNETQIDAVNEKIKSITARHAYAGQIMVIADAATAAGDCRIEWAEGGVERNIQATWDAVEQTMGVDAPPAPTLS
jgi:flagellar assembly protein FliH